MISQAEINTIKQSMDQAIIGPYPEECITIDRAIIKRLLDDLDYCMEVLGILRQAYRQFVCADVDGCEEARERLLDKIMTDEEFMAWLTGPDADRARPGSST